ncbi:hypothetical protein [Arthrobacter sp. C152]
MAKDYAQDLSGMGQPISLGTYLARMGGRAARALGPRCPYRVGDIVTADDPFSGRREGVVVWQDRQSVGVKTARGVFFYDHRLVRPQD